MHCFKRVLLSGLFFISYVHADLADLHDEFVDLKNRNQSYIEQNKDSLSIKRPKQPSLNHVKRYEEAIALRQSVLEKPQLKELLGNNQDASLCAPQIMYLFISLGMGETELKQLFEMASTYTEMPIHLILRGPLPGMKLDQAIYHVNSLANDWIPKVNIEMNPKAFKEYDIQSVPALIWANSPTRNRIMCKYQSYARVIGISEPQYLTKTNAHLVPNDFGVRGPTEEIIEVDLMELMKQRMSNIDWEEKKKAAVSRFWTNYNFPDLLPSKENRQRIIDAKVVVTQDIKDHLGNVLVPAGSEREPLDIIPWRSDIVLFDATRPDQLDWAEKELNARKGTNPIAIFTDIDRKHGFKRIGEISNRFGVPIYAMVPELIPVFQLERVPAIVSSKDKDYVVTEYVPNALSTGN